MHIAYLVNTYPRASHSFIRREVQALERQGHAIHRFAMRSERAALRDPTDLAEDARTEHVLLRGPLALVRATFAALAHPARLWSAVTLAVACGRRAGAPGRHLVYLAEAAYIARRCRMLGIHHLHAHFGTNSATVAMLSAVLGGLTYSFTVHGPEEFDAPLALSLPEKMRRAAFTVAVSDYGRSQLCRWVDPDVWPRLKVVHCGIDPAAFPAALPMPTGAPHLVAIGRFAPQKGFARLIEAMALAAPDAPDLRLTFVGDGELRAQMTAQVAALGLSDRVQFAGWQDEAGVRAALAAAQALVLPSFAEGLPVVVMEAMAAGRPVIATWVAGVPELVRDGVDGWLVAPGDAAGLAAALGTFAKTPAARLAAMGAHARARALARHNVDAEAARLAAHFAKAVAPAPTAPRR